MGALVFLDEDRLPQDCAAGRDPETVEGRELLQLVYLTPNLEGLFIRLHHGYETQCVAADDTDKRLRQLWPEYQKPMPATTLNTRFDLEDLRRAALHDYQLRP